MASVFDQMYQNSDGSWAWGGTNSPSVAAPVNSSPTGSTSWMDTANSWMGFASKGISALTGLGNIYNAYQANKMAQQQFNFSKALAETNLANTAKTINNTYDSGANISAQLGATTPGQSIANSAIIDTYKKNAQNQHVASSIS